jgi:lipopolysaccharide transport system ATP-binding protein
MNHDIAVCVEGVFKKFATHLKCSMLYGVQDIVCDLLGFSTYSDQLRKDEFWALQDVFFELKPGDAFGIVGPNGSGKTTLLKILNGIIKPDRGRVHIRGRVGSLIELGAGFHPILTGRENIYVNGSILGMSGKEIKRKFDSIVDFAGIGDFLDMPVKNYSSGMYVRLGFAVAVHCEPDILLVDEVLSVGDMAFQRKCFQYIEENILRKGVILCLVSHSIYTIARLCSRALLLNHGVVKYAGDAAGVVPEYYKTMSSYFVKKTTPTRTDGLRREGVGEIRVVRVDMFDGFDREVNSIQPGEAVEFKVHLFAVREMPFMPIVSLKISDMSGTVIAYSRILQRDRMQIRLKKGENAISCRFRSVNLMPGQYMLEVKIGGGHDLVQDILRDAKLFEVLSNPLVLESTTGGCMIFLESIWQLV